MLAKAKKFYVGFSALLLLAYIWLFGFMFLGNRNPLVILGCWFKKITNLPCPACGSTRAVNLLLKGHFLQAFLLNPLSYILVVSLFVSSILLVVDVFLNKKILYQLYQKINILFSQKIIAAIGILLVLANWIWNIYKHN